MGLDAGQVRDLIVRPTLEYLGLPRGIAAEKLVLGTAAQESQFKYLKQLGKGPALGLWQCEPATFEDLWVRMPVELRSKVRRFRNPLMPGGELVGDSYREDLICNLRFACAMCRVHYYMRKKLKLSEDADMPKIAGWWKEHYNTHRGKGTTDQFLASWKSTGCEKLYA